MKVFDGHNDTLVEFFNHKSKPKEFGEEQTFSDLDFVRCQKGDFGGGLFGIFTSPPRDSPESASGYGLTITDTGYTMTMQSAQDPEYVQQFTHTIINYAQDIENALSGKVKIIKTYHDLTDARKRNLIAMVLHIEGADCIDINLDNLQKFYDEGVRSLGVVWSRPNIFGCGVPFVFPGSPNTGDGLTSDGKRLVKVCNEMGVMVDLAHINEKGFWDVARTSNKPLVVSYAGVHALCQSTRNLTDAQLDEVGKSEGVVGIIFEPLNTRPDGKHDDDTPLTVIVDHIRYVAERIGIDHVALGSDFDGAQTPKQLKCVADLPNLMDELQTSGFSNEEIENIAYKNWFRVLKQTW